MTYPPLSCDERLVRDLIVTVFRLNGSIIETGNRLVKDVNLTSTLWQLLDALDSAGVAMPVAHIARTMGLTRQSVQRGVDILESRGFVTLGDNPHHRTSRLVIPTEDGMGALRAAQLRQQPLADQLVARFGKAELARVTDLLADVATLIAQSKPDDRRNAE